MDINRVLDIIRCQIQGSSSSSPSATPDEVALADQMKGMRGRCCNMMTGDDDSLLIPYFRSFPGIDERRD